MDFKADLLEIKELASAISNGGDLYDATKIAMIAEDLISQIDDYRTAKPAAEILTCTMQPTTKIVDVDFAGSREPSKVRIWQGHDQCGVAVAMMVVRTVTGDQESAETEARFLKQLDNAAEPRPDLGAIPLRLIL